MNRNLLVLYPSLNAPVSPRWVLCANHTEPVRGFLGRYLRRKLMEMEISSRTRSLELVRIVDWVPRVWHHLNRFLETHSSSDVTIGRWGGGGRPGTAGGLFPWQSAIIALCSVCAPQDRGSSCPAPWMWRGPGCGSRTCGTTPSSPTCWRPCERVCR